jgi:twitching motility two-component system response regulator PilH
VFALKKILRSAGFITIEALDAETGLSLARSDSPDLIFLDIILPGVNGFAALRALRRDPLTQHIPVIMISGNEQATELFFGSRIGADDFMKKPFSRFEVFARIERLLDADMIPRRITSADEDGDNILPV